ncbi:WGxxGxxG-CTERM domain-containing protein [Paenibacillus sp. P36]|uniref:WGxxGxxG-CTERM domain-containing protein n=1 Tax=Paenibacillus sp. P36 TaxID=3342538 RepID=UPI0038B3D68E
MKKFRTVTLAVALTTALSFGAVGAHANMSTPTMNTHTGTSGTLGTGTTTTSGYSGSTYDATTGTSVGTGLLNGTGTMTNTNTYNGVTTPITSPNAVAPTAHPHRIDGLYRNDGTTTNTYTGKSTGTGTGVLGQINGYGNNLMDRMSTTSTGTNRGNYDTSSYRAYATTTSDKSMNWGWLGLVGLIGLAGLRGGNRNRDESYK